MMCIEEDATAATAAAPQKHNNQLVYGRGAFGELHLEQLVRRKRRRRGADSIVQLGLIDGRWLAEAEQHNNQPPSRIEGESIEVVSRFGEQQTAETQQSAKRE